MNNTFFDLVEHNHIMATPTQNEEAEYYDSFVVLDSTRAVVANFKDFDDACSWARTAATLAKTHHIVITLEVYGCDSEGYSTEVLGSSAALDELFCYLSRDNKQEFIEHVEQMYDLEL